MFAGTQSISAAKAIGVPARWTRSPWLNPAEPREVCCRRRCGKRLRRGGERAVAFVDVNGLAHERDAEMLLPFARGKLVRCLDGLTERFDPLGFFLHRFHQNAPVQFLRRLETKNAKNGWR